MLDHYPALYRSVPVNNAQDVDTIGDRYQVHFYALPSGGRVQSLAVYGSALSVKEGQDGPPAERTIEKLDDDPVRSRLRGDRQTWCVPR
jgi:hypothetical protein